MVRLRIHPATRCKADKGVWITRNVAKGDVDKPIEDVLDKYFLSDDVLSDQVCSPGSTDVNEICALVRLKCVYDKVQNGTMDGPFGAKAHGNVVELTETLYDLLEGKDKLDMIVGLYEAEND
jgi:hypothetical protein